MASTSSTPPAISLTDAPEAIEGGQALPAPADRIRRRPASPASTGRNASRPSCRAAPACGSTASALRRRSRIRTSRASSARSATASCRKGPKAQASATFGDGIGVAAASKKKEAAYLYCQWAVSKRWARGCCRRAAACRSATSILATRETRAGVEDAGRPGSTPSSSSGKISRLGLPVIIPVDGVPRRDRHRAHQPPRPAAIRRPS